GGTPRALARARVAGKGRRGAAPPGSRDGALRQGAAPEPRIRLWWPRSRRVLPEGRELGLLDPRLPGARPRGKRRLARPVEGARSSHEHGGGARLGMRVPGPAARVPGGP